MSGGLFLFLKIMERIYHRYEVWEDYPAGFYDNISGRNKSEMIDKVVELFSDSELTREYMNRVLNEWLYSCEHNLTNVALNRVAYLGQAACCIYAGIPSTVTMEAWSLVSEDNRKKADQLAEEIIKEYELKPRQLCLKF